MRNVASVALSHTPWRAAVKAARAVLIKAAFFSFFINVLMLTGPLYMLQVYDRVLSSRSYETLAVLTALVFALFSAMAVLDFARAALLSRAGEAFEEKIKDIAFSASMRASVRGVMQADQPFRDLRQIRQLVASPAMSAVFDAPWTPLYLAIIFMMHWLLGVVALAGLLILLALSFVNDSVSREANVKAQALSAQADLLANAVLRNGAVVRAMGMQSRLKNRWSAFGDNANASALTAGDRIGGLTAVSKAARLFLQSAILGTGAYLAINGAASPGVMIAASIIAGRALAPMEVITGQWRSFSLAAGAYRRLQASIGATPPEPERTPLPAPTGAVKVDRLYCQPGAAKGPVLKSVSFSIVRGETLGVIGPSGAGKTTLIRALAGVEPALSGDIRIDGACLTQWNSDLLGDHIGFLPQDVELFAGSAAQNIARFVDAPEEGAVIAAAKAAGAHEMTLSLAEGYDTDIGDRGQHLSAGQRQRLGLARALYGEPALVLLDEPNANLDGEGDAALAAALKGLKSRGASVIIISHRPSVLALVDKILVLAEGEVCAFGPRDEVLRSLKATPDRSTFPTGGNALNIAASARAS